MSEQSILNADMTTVGGWLADGLRWWVAQLESMMPEALRGARLKRYWCVTPDNELVEVSDDDTHAIDPDVARSATGPLGFASSHCIVREIELPAMSAADLAKMIALDADRIFPLPVETLLVCGARQSDGVASEGRMIVKVGAIRRDTVSTALERALAARYRTDRIVLAPESPGALLDATASATAAGLIVSQSTSRAGWWTVVLFLFALNLGLLIWRDQARVDAAAALVDAQAPGVAAARTIAQRITTFQQSAELLVRKRERQDAIRALEAVTRALPEQAWVQRYAWDGAAIRVSGYKRAGVDVASTLRKQGFSDVKSNNADASAELPTGQPFDIAARWSPPR